MSTDRLRQQLVRDEGLRLRPYVDTAGKITIGVGRNLTDRGITTAEAFLLLDHDLASCVADLARRLPWTSTLDPVRRDVLLNMCFNLGIDRLCGFRLMLAHAAAGRFPDAAREMVRSAWWHQVGPRATRLAQQMATGVTA